jgi:3-oxoacyl-[acyl-carrier-protein] synthase-3
LRRYPDGLSAAEQDRLIAETGIQTRHFAIDPVDPSRRESNTAMASIAGQRALDAAGWTADAVDLLVVTTVIPDHLMPPTSTLVQEQLGIARCAEVEISANCSAPYKGLLFAVSQLELGHARRALLCSSQCISFLGYPPWSNPELMGPAQGSLRWIVSDGAAALALERTDDEHSIRVWLESSGPGKRSGMSLPLGAADPDLQTAFGRGAQHVSQDIRYVLREGFALAVTAIERMLASFAVRGDEIDHFILSVSSMQVVRKLQPLLASRCGLRPNVWRMNFTRVGYLGGVTLPFTLDELARDGQVRSGDLVCSFAEESSKWMCAGTVFRWT